MSTPPKQPSPVEFSDIIALVDLSDSWPELLPAAISLARRESARLRVLVCPAADGDSRLDEVRGELQCHDIRTLPFGVQCTAAGEPIRQTLADMLQESPWPLVLLLRSPTNETASDTVSVAVASLLAPAPAMEQDSSHPANSTLRRFVKRG
ncbi:MAG: hypothetical protein ACKO2L_02460 [Planctomycetaceae bacterium]